MPLQFTSVPESNYSFGIDARSAENQISEGFVRDLLNADIIETRVSKRPGYAGYAGNIPVRVLGLDYNDASNANEICFTLDGSISLEEVRSSPIVVYGKSSNISSGGPFTTAGNVSKYYSNYTVPIRKQWAAPSGTLAVSGEENDLGTTNAFVSVVESTSLTNRSHNKIDADSIEISTSNYDISIDYITFADRNVFVYYSDKDAVTGSSYIHTTGSLANATTHTVSIPAGTHNLSNYNIITQIQQHGTGIREYVLPDTVEIDANGDVDVVITNDTGASQVYTIILSAAPASNILTGTVNATSTGSIVLNGLDNPWIFYSIYLEQTPGGIKELVQSDSVEYDSVTNQLEITFTNNNSTSRNFIIYYEYGSIRSNQLCVTDTSVSTTASDTRPQLTLWGLEHTEMYPGGTVARESWTTHLDSYRRSGEQRMIAGLGGNIFSAQTYQEAGTTYKYAQLYPNLYGRTSTSKILGPLIWDTGDTPARTRGYITSSSGGAHWGTVTAVAYDSNNGWTKYTISLPAKSILDSTGTPTTLTSVISTTTNLEDWLTVTGMSWERHSGTFRIKQVQDGTNEISIWVENDAVDSNDFNDSGTAGSAGVFTDQLSWLDAAPFINEDVLVSEAIPTTLTLTAISSVSTTTVTSGWDELLEIPAGVLLAGSRVSSVVPLRAPTPTPVANIDNLVRGDMLSYTGLDRELRVRFINADSDRAVTISVSSGTATATLASGDTTFLTVGQKILLVRAGVYSGVHTILDIISTTAFTFTTTETTSGSGTLVGATAEIDEELAWSDLQGDLNVFRVEKRWIPVEAPEDSFNLPPNTYIRHLDAEEYDNQSFLRSTMVSDNLYLSNYQNEVYKYDGSNMYRAGLPAWQPGLFLTQDTTATAKIVTDNRSISYAVAPLASQGKIQIATTDVNAIPEGSSVRISGNSATFTIRGYDTSGSNPYIILDRALGTVDATGTVSEIATYRYYYRLNAVDVNNNIIASATTGHQDHVIELTANAAVYHKLVGFPIWDNYDYDRLEVQIYRTRKNTSAPFYRVTTLPLSFNNTTGYIEFTDSFADSDLTNLDEVNTALKGAELGVAFSEPVRAKYITSIGNRKVLAHVQEYPQLDIQIVGNANLTESDFAGDSLLFRRNNNDTGTVTNNVDRILYEWRDTSASATVSGITGTANTSFTVTASHSAQAGDWVYLHHTAVATADLPLKYAGWWQIASVGVGEFTINYAEADAGAISDFPDGALFASDPTNVPVPMGVDGNLGMVNGDSFDTFNAMRRMSMAINATMRQVDTTITGMEDFQPWLMARSGNDTPPAGRLIVKQPRVDAVTFECVPTFSGYNVFINSIKRTSGQQISASTKIFPSRILVSYENYSEIFDNVDTILDKDSDSAIDINSADGQEITGVIPFFGESAFGAAQQSGILVVFKTNSIYLVDINQKVAGNNAVQRIETEGLGCTAPYSIASTKGGIMFANESGIYSLRRNQAIEYIGKYMERNWSGRVDTEQLELFHGHHYNTGRSYKLSVPLLQQTEPTEVYVYNHTGESEGRQGAWGRYDSHNAIGWANLNANAFWASTYGRVLVIRNTQSQADYRDDNGAIEMRLDTRFLNFGSGAIRKVLDSVVVHYRSGALAEGTEVSYSLDMEDEYEQTTESFIVNPRPNSNTGLGDEVGQVIVSIKHNTSRSRGTYFSIRIQNNGLDENVEIAGMDMRVAGLSDRGLKQAADAK